MSQVFVLDTNKQPLNPVHPGCARLLLKQGKAAVYRRYPFTLILKRTVERPELQPLRVKIDPGSQTTGLALVNDASGEVVWAAEVRHRGGQIKRALDKRRAARHSRRRRHTRYRAPRFRNRRPRTGALPPSLESRVCNVLTWVRRLMRLCPITAISQELVRFDTQALQNPQIEGLEYQQGTLWGYEVREYVLLKWQHQCAYCDARAVPLELDHVQPRAKGGSNRVSNLTLACTSCNQRKGNQDVRDFLKGQPERLARLLGHLKTPLKDAAAVNMTRWDLYERLSALGLRVERGSGGLTKYNRVRRGLPKAHWLDAACVGRSTPSALDVRGIVPLQITATGHGSRQMCRMDKYGFPRTGPKQHKRVQGFQTGDLARAVVTSGTKQGTYVGKVAIRSRGTFNITTAHGVVTDIHHRWCRLEARADGYTYQQRKEAAFPPPSDRLEVPTPHTFMAVHSISRRFCYCCCFLGTLLLLVGLLSSSAHADGGAPQLAYVAGAAQGISIIDIAQRRVTGTIAVAGNPRTALLSPDGQALYVTQPTLGRVVVIVAKTGKTLCTASLPGQPSLLALSLDAAALYAAGRGDTSVRALDPTTCAVQRTFETHEPVYGLAVTASTSAAATPSTPNQLWITGNTSLTIFEVNGHLLGSVPIADGPQDICIPGGFTAYITTRQGTVVAVDLSTRQVVRTLLRGGQFGPMDYDANTGEVYVPDRRHNQLDVLTPVTAGTTVTQQEPARIIHLGSSPQSVAITSDGQLGFVALSNGQVLMLDIPSRSIVTSIAVGGTPHFIITGLYPPVKGPPPTPQQPVTPPSSLQPIGRLLLIFSTVLAGIVLLAILLLLWRYYRHRFDGRRSDRKGRQ